MKLDLPRVAALCRNAGFDHDNIIVATAVALIASGANTTFDYRPGSPGAGHYVGLWALDIDHHPDYAAHDLHDGQTAAHVAYTLTSDAGGWSWSPVWRAGHWRAYAAHVATEATRWHDLPVAGRPMMLAAHQGRTAARTAATAVRATMYAQHPTRGATKWPTPTT